MPSAPARGRGLLKAFAGRQDDPGGPVIGAPH
jgi:hypothetical protein